MPCVRSRTITKHTLARKPWKLSEIPFYVDDCLELVDDVDVAICLVKELDLLLKSGGFHLSKYVSNCRSLLSEICDITQTTALHP